MQQRVLQVLEFHKVKERLATHAASSLGQEKVNQLVPESDYETVVQMQAETDEATNVLRLKGTVPLAGIFDIRESVKRAYIGGALNATELLNIASTISTVKQLKRFIEDITDAQIPILVNYCEQMIVLNHLEQAIKDCIDDNGVILDSASDKLRTIRAQLRSSESRIREKLENTIRSSSTQKMLSDALITIRNDRYVIPVKQEYRSAFGGIVHDQSSSGATLFIEPQSVVELNNKLQEARVKEKQEIDRILQELTVKVAQEETSLTINVDVLAELDFLFTKAKYGQKMKASKPIMNNNGIIKLKKARHPLIPNNIVVPNDIMLGKDYTAIVITGPNTGGKTVALKTIGLLTLMTQSGLQIPALDGSEMTVFHDVFADIGDEQSIEQNLSTFSSHMVNIVDILQHVDSQSLVLFDELGAGTDPQEGAALAISILDEITKRKARVIATTHYPELKAYGYNREGVINASMEFDIDKLSPTYKLLIGVPGRSNAFEISKRLGLNDDIIHIAKQHISSESNKVENMIASLEKSRRNAEEELKVAEDLRKEAEKLHLELQKQIIEFNEQRDTIYEKAVNKAENIINKARDDAEDVIRELRKMRMDQAANVKEHELIEARRKLAEAIPEHKKHGQIQKKKEQKRQLYPGDEVKVISVNQKGYLLEKTSNNEWQVQFGILKMKVKESDLEFVSGAKKVETKPIATVKGKDFHVKLELDLRGERYEDALLKVEKYIDDALLAGYPRVSIIHGKGTGVLRKGVQEFLKNHRSVKGMRFGESGEGGSGVTVVEFK